MTGRSTADGIDAADLGAAGETSTVADVAPFGGLSFPVHAAARTAIAAKPTAEYLALLGMT
ncbi:hypothetical protein NDR87_19295 [Nocardia sp. CDC159]|uniref:Uncharacterized protein n=1 Tax=Nocardia pulmonis TaxID=2951408 RepID=A0A9X2E8M3_9NOCA|nr:MULTISPECIES: hypothetical protein [Nocardia]MCM6776162.1 hypothetical protein [Nocardia pulmonis]MCM6788511.1 hypothetical protein [Nocardia sp. CDC159]